MRLIFPRYKWIFFSIVFFIIAIPIAGFLIPKNNPEIPIKNFTPVQKPADPCSQFPTSLGAISLREISCEEAKTIAVKKYPGQVLNIEKATLPYQAGKPPKTQKEERKVWLINIKPNDLSLIPVPPKDPKKEESQVLETVGAVVDRNTKEILFLRLFFKK